MADNIQYRRLRAPTKHGQCLIDPPLVQSSASLASNLKLFENQNYDLQDQSLSELSQNARKHLLSEAIKYTKSYLNVEDDFQTAITQSKPLILSGHQPTLFHPGAWVKNFGLSRIATENQALAINLIIDNDLVKNHWIQVPTGSVDHPQVERIAFDQGENTSEVNIPFEQYNISDQELFQSFGSRVAQSLKPFVANPLINQLWPLAIERSKQERNLGIVLSQARHQYEQQLGLQTLEVPLSTICHSDSFHWFTAHLLTNLPRFWKIYNQCADEYRKVHRIKNLAQPVPNLVIKEDWLEAPFWFIGEDRKRRAMFVRQSDSKLLVSDRDKIEFSLPLNSDATFAQTVKALSQHSKQKINIRPRALITTLYARMVLSDLFIHGIGGTKYDQITDLIISRFFGLTAPSFVTITATVHLPLQRKNEPDESLESVANHLRELEFRPERQLAFTTQTDDNQQIIDHLLAQKILLLQQAQSRSKHLEIKEVNQQLQPFLENRRNQLQQHRTELQDQLTTDKVLFSREYAFCLFSEKTLSDLLLDIVGHKPYIYKS